MKNKITIVILAILLVVGCVQIPTQQFVQYKKAFSELDEVQEDILLDFDQALKKNEEREEGNKTKASTDGSVVLKAPYSIELSGLELIESKPGIIEVRRQALQAITQYNEVLTKLVEGKSIEDVKTSSAGLINTIGKFAEVANGSGIPGLGSIISMASIFAEKIEAARVRKEFKKAVREGAPLVTQMLDLMRDDRRYHYSIRATIAQEERLLIVDQITTNVKYLYVLSANSIVGTDDEDFPMFISEIENEVNTHLESVLGELEDYPYTLTFGNDDTSTYTDLTISQIEQNVNEIKSLAVKYDKNVSQVKAIGSTMIEYAKLIDKTKIALDTLNKALDKPQDIGIVGEEILETVFSLKREFEAYRSAQ